MLQPRALQGDELGALRPPLSFSLSDSSIIGLQGCIACHDVDGKTTYEGFRKPEKLFSSCAHAIHHINHMRFVWQFMVVEKLRRDLGLCLLGWCMSVTVGSADVLQSVKKAVMMGSGPTWELRRRLFKSTDLNLCSNRNSFSVLTFLLKSF